MKINRFILFLLISFASAVALAQNKTVIGVVMEAGINEPVFGANVVVVNQQNRTLTGTTTDMDGNYVFFTDNSVGSIVKPAKRCIPSRSARMPYPIKLTREIPRIRPVKKLNWSNKSNISFWD